MPKKSSSDTAPFTFRLSSSDRQWLESTAAAHGVEVSQLVRWAVEALRQYVEAHDGKLHLPIDIRAFWSQLTQIADRPLAALPTEGEETAAAATQVKARAPRTGTAG